MIISGKAVVLTGRFTEFSRAEAKRGLEELGAKVTGSVSARTDLVFAGADAGSKASAAAARGVPIYDEAALRAVLAGEDRDDVAEIPEFAGVPDPQAGPGAALDRLRRADWSAFVAERDVVALRDSLEELERSGGITEAHRFATQRIRELGALLRHPDVHPGNITAHALSPCGRYLAIGSWCGDDYDRGGALQLWEVTTARCVNVIDGIRGGIGWPGTPRNLQWSADGSRIAAEFDTNQTGVWDPFGTEAEPIAEAFFFAGAKPTGFALAPDGKRACVFQGLPYSVLSSIVSILDGEVSGPPDGEAAGPAPLQFRPLPRDAGEVLGNDGILFDRTFWSRDGARIYGDVGQGRWAVSFDAEKRRLTWFLETGDESGPPPEWSPDERLLAYQHGGRLAISDAVTGQRLHDLPSYPGKAYLAWGPGGRLAVVVTADPDVDAAPVVGIIDANTGEHRYDLPLSLDSSSPHDSDHRSWAWSPDGERAACATADGGIEIWSLGEKPERLHALDGIQRSMDGYVYTFSVVWAAHDVVIAVGPHALRFIRATTGETIGDFAFHHAPLAPRPLELDGRDLGADLRPDPTFALDGDTWAVAFETGTAIAAPGREDDLPDLLAWSVGNRFAWPIRWGDLAVFPDAPAAADAEELLAPFRGRAAAAGTGEWPPQPTATLDDLILAIRSGFADLSPKSDVHAEWIDTTLQQAAMIRVRRGEAAEAVALAALLPDNERRVLHTAKIALALGAAGFRAEAAQVFPHDDPEVEAAEDEPGLAAVVAGACEVLGEHERAARWFARAREAADADPQAWAQRLWLVWSLMECGRDEEARDVLESGERVPKNLLLEDPWLAYLVRSDRVDLVRELLHRSRRELSPGFFVRAMDKWFDSYDADRVFAAAGQPELLRLWGDIYRSVDRALPEAERNAAGGRPSGPTEAEVRALAEAHAGLEDVSKPDRSRALADLARQAAAWRHIDAVLDLLPQLRAPDAHGLNGNDRPWVARSALLIIATGADVEVW